MKLKTVQVRNFRSILDSNEVPIGDLTCLVGKNEAGKTAFLKALEGLRSTDASYKRYTVTENYPRRHRADYDQRHPDGDAIVMETVWKMDSSDVATVEGELGAKVLTSDEISICKYYESDNTRWSVPIDEEKALKHLIAKHVLDKTETAQLRNAKNTQEAASLLESRAERSEAQNALLATIKSFPEKSAYLRVIGLLEPRTPKFLYFSHYDRMSGALSVAKLN